MGGAGSSQVSSTGVDQPWGQTRSLRAIVTFYRAEPARPLSCRVWPASVRSAADGGDRWLGLVVTFTAPLSPLCPRSSVTHTRGAPPWASSRAGWRLPVCRLSRVCPASVPPRRGRVPAPWSWGLRGRAPRCLPPAPPRPLRLRSWSPPSTRGEEPGFLPLLRSGPCLRLATPKPLAVRGRVPGAQWGVTGPCTRSCRDSGDRGRPGQLPPRLTLTEPYPVWALFQKVSFGLPNVSSLALAAELTCPVSGRCARRSEASLRAAPPRPLSRGFPGPAGTFPLRAAGVAARGQRDPVAAVGAPSPTVSVVSARCFIHFPYCQSTQWASRVCSELGFR